MSDGSATLGPRPVLSDLALKTWMASVSVAVTLLLTVGKLVFGLLTGSLALLADGLQGLIDVIVTLATLMFILAAARAACPAWTLGRTRLEAMAALVEAALLAIIAVCIWYLALQKFIFDHHMAEVEVWHIVGIGAAVLIDGVRANLLHRVAKRTGSLALEANAEHFRADSLGSLFVLVGMGLAHLGWPMGDSLATLALAGLLGLTAWRVGCRAGRLLLDVADPAESLAALAALQDHPQVQDVPVLRMHRRPKGYDVVAEVRVAPQADLVELRHTLERRVARAVRTGSVLVVPTPS